MCAAFSAGRVVDAVAGHRHHLAARHQRCHEFELCARRDARMHGVGFGDAGLRGDGARGDRVVAGQHQHADAGLAAFLHRLAHAGAQRVGQRHQAQPLKANSAGSAGHALPLEAGLRHGQHAQAACAHGLGLRMAAARSSSPSRHSAATASGAPLRPRCRRVRRAIARHASSPCARARGRIHAPVPPPPRSGEGGRCSAASAISARSIGSKGCFAGPAARLRAGRGRLAAASPPARQQCHCAPSRRTSSATAMWFSVSVPVLSVASTVAAPSVFDHRGAPRQHRRWRDSRQAPIAMKTVRMSTNSGQHRHRQRDAGASSPASQSPRCRP